MVSVGDLEFCAANHAKNPPLDLKGQAGKIIVGILGDPTPFVCELFFG